MASGRGSNLRREEQITRLQEQSAARRAEKQQRFEKAKESMVQILQEVQALHQEIEHERQKLKDNQQIDLALVIMRLRKKQVQELQAFLAMDLSLILEDEETKGRLSRDSLTIWRLALISMYPIVHYLFKDSGAQHPSWLEEVTSFLGILEQNLVPFLQERQAVLERAQEMKPSSTQGLPQWQTSWQAFLGMHDAAVEMQSFLKLYGDLSNISYDHPRKVFVLVQRVHNQLSVPAVKDPTLAELLVGVLEDRERQLIQHWSLALKKKIDTCESSKWGIFEKEVKQLSQLVNNWYGHYGHNKGISFFDLTEDQLRADPVLDMIHQCTLWIVEYEAQRREQELAVNAAIVAIAPKLAEVPVAEANKKSLSPAPVQTPEQKLEQLNIKEVQDALEASKADWTKATNQILNSLQVKKADDPFLLAEAYHKISGFLQQCVVLPNQNTLTCNCQLLSEAFRLCELAQQISLKNQGQDPARTLQLVEANAWQMEAIINQKEQIVRGAQERLNADLERSRIKKEAAKARKGGPKPKAKSEKTKAQEAWRDELGLLSKTFERELESKEIRVQEADEAVLKVRQELSSPKIGTRNQQVAAEAAVS